MEILKKGTKVLMHGRTDFIFYRFKDLETKEIIKVNLHEDVEKAIEGRNVEEICAVSDYIPHEAELYKSIPLLEDYTDTNFDFELEVGNKIINLGRITEFHIYDKMEYNKKVKEKIPEYLEKLRKRADIDALKTNISLSSGHFYIKR